MNLEEALDIINQLGLGLGVTHSKEFELKGYCPDAEDGGLCKFYLCTEEVRQLADAFSAIVDIAGGVSSVAAESERCAGICKEIANSVAMDPGSCEADAAWAEGWISASTTIERRIRGEK